MELFLFLQLFFLISLTYGTRDEASSSQPVVLSEDDKIRDSDCVCRLETKNRIIGGDEALAHSIPWQVSLADSGGKHFCGATIINPNYVLTSASCIKVKKEEDIKVRVGLHNINDPIPEENIFDIEEIYYYISTHPFVPNEPLAEGDIALLQLKKKIKFALGKVEPACLNFIEKPKYEDKLMISGWGFTNSIALNKEKKIELIGEFSPVLKIAYLNQDTENCQSPHVVCTKSDKEVSPSKGDEGGPLHSKSGLFTTVEAVLSEIDKVCESNDILVYLGKQISIYSRISFYENWFKKIIGNNYCNKDLAASRLRDFFLAHIPSDPVDSFDPIGLLRPIVQSVPKVTSRQRDLSRPINLSCLKDPIGPSNPTVLPNTHASSSSKKGKKIVESYPIVQFDQIDTSYIIDTSNPTVLPNTHGSSSSSKKGKKIVESGPIDPSNTEVSSEIDIDLCKKFYKFFNIDPSDPIGILRPIVHSDQIVQSNQRDLSRPINLSGPKVPSNPTVLPNTHASSSKKAKKIVESYPILPPRSKKRKKIVESGPKVFSLQRDLSRPINLSGPKVQFDPIDPSNPTVLPNTHASSFPPKKGKTIVEFYPIVQFDQIYTSYIIDTSNPTVLPNTHASSSPPKKGKKIVESGPIDPSNTEVSSESDVELWNEFYEFFNIDPSDPIDLSDPIGLSRPIVQSNPIDPSLPIVQFDQIDPPYIIDTSNPIDPSVPIVPPRAKKRKRIDQSDLIPDNDIFKWLESFYTEGDNNDFVKRDYILREFYDFFKIKSDTANHYSFKARIGKQIKKLVPIVKKTQLVNPVPGQPIQECYQFLKKISDPIGLSRPIVQSDPIDSSNRKVSSERDIPDDEISKWLKSSYTEGDESDLIKRDDLWREFYEFFKIKSDVADHLKFTMKIGKIIMKQFPSAKRAQLSNPVPGLPLQQCYRFLKKI